MDKLIITGGRPLQGAINISGAKNAALPLMAASLLTDKPLTLHRVPELADIATMQQLLEQHGVNAHSEQESNGRCMMLSAANVHQFTAPYELVRKMRASILVLGPLLARFGAAKVSLPGGCAIGTRPVDLHLKALEAMGALIELKDGYIHASAPEGLNGVEFTFGTVSVGATENIIMAATLAKGTTILKNAACEPEVQDLAQCLIKMGAKIEGIGTNTLTIMGVSALHAAEHHVVADRIEAGTYAAAVAACGGEVRLMGLDPFLLSNVWNLFRKAGIEVEEGADCVRVARDPEDRLKGGDMMTQVYPGFPTDMQAQCMAMMVCAEGASMITETIFENRFMHVPELVRMGADITVHTGSALVRGVEKLKGAEVMASDLRASASLIVAALAAEGETVIHRIYHLDRGYERLEEKLGMLGANVRRVGEKLQLVEEAA